MYILESEVFPDAAAMTSKRRRFPKYRDEDGENGVDGRIDVELQMTGPNLRGKVLTGQRRGERIAVKCYLRVY